MLEGDSVEEVLDAERARIEAIDAGRDLLQQFRDSGALTVILLEARANAIEALSELVRCDPFKPDIVRDLQWRITRYDALCDWISGIIEQARMATEDLTAEEEASLDHLLRGDESEAKDA